MNFENYQNIKNLTRRNMHSDSLDTNLIVHFILNDIPGQREKVANLLETPHTTHFLSDIAISETVYVLETVYSQTRDEIINELNFFLTRYSNQINFNRTLTMNVFPIYLKHPKISFNDCLMTAYAKINHHEPLFTFDQKLASQLPSTKLL